MPNAEAVYAGRNVALYTAPYESANALPADTVAWGTDWGDPWENVGYTQEGVTLALSIEREEIMVDQILDPVLLPASGRNISIRSNLAEWTGENLARGFGQGEIATTAPGASTRGFTDFTLGSSIQDRFDSWGIDFQKPYDGEAIRVLGKRGMAMGEVEGTFGTFDDNAKIPIDIRLLPDDSVDPSELLLVHDLIPATGP